MTADKVLDAIKALRDSNDPINYVVVHDPLEDEDWLKTGTGGYSEFQTVMDPTIVKVCDLEVLKTLVGVLSN
jgi:hypothetical protein